MYSRLQEEIPHQKTTNQVGNGASDANSVKNEEYHEDNSRNSKRSQAEVCCVEYCNYQYGAKVINNCQRSKEDF